MTLSIVIPTHKRVEAVSLLIHSLYEQNFERESLQVLLVSNFKEKELEKLSQQWLNWFYDFRLINVGEKGVNKARNMGVRFAFGDIVYFLDDDCLLDDKNHLKKILEFHQKYKNAAGIGGGYKMKGDSSGTSQFYYSQAMEWIKKFLKNDNFTLQLPGGNASYKREVFDKGFSYDPKIVFGGSEEGFNQVLCENGYSLMFFKELDVLHVVQLNLHGLLKKGFLQGAGYFKNRHNQGQSLSFLMDMKREGAVYRNPLMADYKGKSFVYNFFFKMGYFWEASKNFRSFLPFRLVYFFLLILKSRWFVWRPFEKIEWVLGRIWWLIGMYVWKPLGHIWWFLGMYMWRPISWVLGRIWWLIGMYIWKPLGHIWWFLGMYMWRPISWVLGRIWWFLGVYMWRPISWVLGRIWWFLGMYIWRPISWVLGRVWWLVGMYVWKPLGHIWWFLGMYMWRPISWVLGRIWWLIGMYIWKPLGHIWWFLGMYMWRPISWVLGRIWWLIGMYVWKPLGHIWWFLGMYMWRPISWVLGRIWWLIGMYIWRPISWVLGRIWWLIGMYVWKPLGHIWWFLGMYIWRPISWVLGRIWWLIGMYIWKPLGHIWWFLGMYIWRPISWVLGRVWWLVGMYVWKPLGHIWWFLGMYVWRPISWVLGRVWWLIGMYVWRPISWLWGHIWWFLGMYMWRPISWVLGRIWWFLGMYVWRLISWVWYKSPFMKIYYFSRYQFYTRFVPLYESFKSNEKIKLFKVEKNVNNKK